MSAIERKHLRSFELIFAFCCAVHLPVESIKGLRQYMNNMNKVDNSYENRCSLRKSLPKKCKQCKRVEILFKYLTANLAGEISYYKYRIRYSAYGMGFI